jgi:hypothetical protein
VSPNLQGFLGPTPTEGTKTMLGKTSRLLAAMVFCTAALLAVRGEAETLPWPGETSRQNAPTAWPTPPAGRASTPAAASPAPMMSTPGAGPMTPIPGASGPGGGGAGAGGAPCMAEFTRLQAETDKHAKAAKEASKRKVSREQMCTQLKSFAAAIGKWAKYTADHAASCGIPSKIVSQLKAGAANIAKSKEQVCAGGMAGPGRPAAPTLSDALGQTAMPTAEPTSRPSVATGTLDTLTGVPIGR